MSSAAYHGWTHRRRELGGTDPYPYEGHFEIKVFADADALDGNLPPSATTVSVGDGKFIFAIADDLDQYDLYAANAYVTTLSSGGDITVMVRNVTQAADMLSTAITIAEGEYASFGPDSTATPSVVGAASLVTMADLVAVDVDAAGSGAKGLGVILEFARI